jgi:hypothetical protein
VSGARFVRNGAAALLFALASVAAERGSTASRSAAEGSRPAPAVTTNRIGMKLAHLPAGEFRMGSGPE